MRKIPLLLSLLLLLSGCVTTQTKESLASSMTSHHADPALIQKVRKGAILDVPDLASILQSGVPEAPLLSYVKQSGATYNLKAQDVTLLTSSKASDAFINYLLQTAKFKNQQPNLQGPQGQQMVVNPALVPNLHR